MRRRAEDAEHLVETLRAQLDVSATEASVLRSKLAEAKSELSRFEGEVGRASDAIDRSSTRGGSGQAAAPATVGSDVPVDSSETIKSLR